MTSEPGTAGPQSGALGLSPARVVQLLAAVEAETGLLLSRSGFGTDLIPLPDDRFFAQSGLSPDLVEQWLPELWTRASHDRRFTWPLPMPAAPRRFALPGRRAEQPQLLILRLDSDRDPTQLLVLYLAHAGHTLAAASHPLDLRLRAAQEAMVSRPAPVPSALHLRTWESLAEALQHGLLLCDADLTVRHINPSAAEGLQLEPLTICGRSLLTLPFDHATRNLLQGMLGQPQPFRRGAEYRRGDNAIPVILSGRLLERGGLLVECLFQDVMRADLASSQLVPFLQSGPPALEQTLPPSLWSGPWTVQALPVTTGASLVQDWWPLGGGVQGWIHLGVPSGHDEWMPWVREVAQRLRAGLGPLTPVPEVLHELISTCLLPRADGFPGWILAGRLAADWRTMECASLGPVGLSAWTHRHRSWQPLAPDRTLYLAHGCPVLQVWQQEALPGEGFCILPSTEPGSAELVRDQLQGLPQAFPHQHWDVLRQVVGDLKGAGGWLLRCTIGVREERLLYPTDFGLFADTLRMRLASRGISDHIQYQVRLALDEVLTNAFRHGHQGDASRPIAVQLLLEPGCLRMSIQDQGLGYDPLALKDPRATEHLQENGGRGIFLTCQMMDQVEFGAGTNHIVLTKYLPDLAAPLLPPRPGSTSAAALES